jgi:rhodanese-related sulfurtransferase
MIGANAVPTASDGLIQLTVDGACTYLVMDAASRSCAVIDPQAALVERITAFLRCQNVQVRAIVGTDVANRDARAALQAAFGAASSDPLGWPAGSMPVELADGSAADAIAIGRQQLVRVDQGSCYLLAASGAHVARQAVQFAFTGSAARARVARVAGSDSVLCAGRDDHNLICTTLGAELAAVAPLGSERCLDAVALEQFLHDHPDALLIDVREHYEHAANGAPACHGLAARSVPLSRLAGELGRWMRAEQRPLVFFCRAGNRSARAAQCAHRLGAAQAWQVSGGLALGDAVLVASEMTA